MPEKKTLSEHDLNQLQTMSAIRIPMQHIAMILGVSKATLERIIRRDPKAKEAVEKGRAIGSAKVIQTAYDMAVSGREPAMTMFWLKTQEGFREVDRLEISGPGGGPVPIEEMTPEQRKLRIDRLLNLRQRLTGSPPAILVGDETKAGGGGNPGGDDEEA